MQRDIITSTITWHLGLVGSNNFVEYTSFSPFTLCECGSRWRTVTGCGLCLVLGVTQVAADVGYESNLVQRINVGYNE